MTYILVITVSVGLWVSKKRKKKISFKILFLFCFPGDPRNYDDYPETDFRKVPPVTDREQRLFDDF